MIWIMLLSMLPLNYIYDSSAFEILLNSFKSKTVWGPCINFVTISGYLSLTLICGISSLLTLPKGATPLS